MKNVVCLILFLISLSPDFYAQHDTIVNCGYYLIFNGEIFNEIKNNNYYGQYIEYKYDSCSSVKHIDYIGWNYATEYNYFDYEPILDSLTNTYRKDAFSYYSNARNKEVRNYLTGDNYQIISQGEFREGKRNGEWKYYNNNCLWSKVVFKNDNPIDSIFYYDELGNTSLIVVPINENFYQKIEFSDDGTLLIDTVERENIRRIFDMPKMHNSKYNELPLR